MIAAELISNVIPPLRTSDTVGKAMERMTEFKIAHLPIVNEQQFLGLVSEDELIEIRNTDEPIGNLSLKLITPFVFGEAHIYDVLSVFNQMKLTVVPVLSAAKNYLGVISERTIVEYASTIYAAVETGAILVLEISNRNNSLAHMAQIVESENAQILSSYVRSFPDSTKLEVTLKTNRTEVSGIIAAFERYNYQVSAVYNNISDNDDADDRYNSLMNYLNV